MVTNSEFRAHESHPTIRRFKKTLSFIVSRFLRLTFFPWDKSRRLWYHAQLSSRLAKPLNESAVVQGMVHVYGTSNISFGRNILLYPNLHLETQLGGSIELGDNVVLSSGVHLVSMTRITIGEGSMIGEYSSVRDARHARVAGVPIRDSGHTGSPISIGNEVWIGRGVTVLGGVTIGDGATVGANAVVIRDVPAGVTVAGVPAQPIRTNTTPEVVALRARSIDQDQANDSYRFATGQSEIASRESK